MYNTEELSSKQIAILEKIRGYSTFVVSKQPQSRNKLLEKIKKSKNYEPYKELFENDDNIHLILDYLTRIELLNDYQIARGRVRSRMNSGWGKTKVLCNVPTTLKVSKELVQQCIDEVYEEFENESNGECFEVETMLSQLRSSRETLHSINDQKSSQRLFRRFISRGFSFSKVKLAIDIYKNELEEENNN